MTQTALTHFSSPMAKNIKISELVHEALEYEKRESETFDDVLRRLLGLNDDQDDLVAYFSPELANIAKDVMKQVKDDGDFETTIETEDERKHLKFKSLDSGLTIVRLSFTEEALIFYYRGLDGNMMNYGYLSEGEDGVYWYKDSRQHEFDHLLDQFRKRVRGAVKRWGEQ